MRAHVIVTGLALALAGAGVGLSQQPAGSAAQAPPRPNGREPAASRSNRLVVYKSPT